MRSYVIASAVFLDLVATAHLVRVLMGWPLVIAGVDVPVWPSAVAAVAVGALAVWGMRLVIKSRATP